MRRVRPGFGTGALRTENRELRTVWAEAFFPPAHHFATVILVSEGRLAPAGRARILT
jgi:hypothetical protein